MAIICLEGPSAVGKTTTSAALAEQGNTYVVSEIAELYGPPPAELGGWDRTQWLLDRQVFRWETAARMSSLQTKIGCGNVRREIQPGPEETSKST